MDQMENSKIRDLLMVLIGALLGFWLSSSFLPESHAQAPSLPSNAQDCGEWVMQTFQGQTKERNAFILNTRTGEVFFLKDERKIVVKSE